jgi:hypothetical protein
MKFGMIKCYFALPFGFVTLALAAHCGAGEFVNAAIKPGGKWKSHPTTLLTDMKVAAVDTGHDRFGGIPSQATRATGFFHTQKIGKRWWLVTPDGGLFVSRGMNSVNQNTTKSGKEALKQKFGTTQAWTRETLGLLRENGFNTLGAWSDVTALKNETLPIARTVLWSFMSSYGKKRGGTRQDAGHTGYPNECPFIFDPDFLTFCDEYAQRLEPSKDDPWVIGNFSDNEMPWSRKMLENYLALPATDPGRIAASEWLLARRSEAVDQLAITDSDRIAFLGYALDRYLTITSAAIRKHAPNHLILGPRLHGPVNHLPEVFAALGRHVDIVCMNYYRAWSPDPELLGMWHRESGKPLMMTEFYAKGEDSGLANTGGAGWLVKTQRDRGAFYQNFTLGLIESGICVGWSWHRYADNDPANTKVDPSNRDSNKGIVSNRYAPFTKLLESMKSLNQHVYGIAGFYDSPLK